MWPFQKMLKTTFQLFSKDKSFMPNDVVPKKTIVATMALPASLDSPLHESIVFTLSNFWLQRNRVLLYMRSEIIDQIIAL